LALANGTRTSHLPGFSPTLGFKVPFPGDALKDLRAFLLKRFLLLMEIKVIRKKSTTPAGEKYFGYT
jgi:hypothetical protein